MVVGYHTGIRPGELLRLRWEQVDLKVGRITLDPGTTKNNDGRTLPIYGEMNAWLSMQQSIQKQKCLDGEFILQRDGLRIGEFYESWRSACKRAGVPPSAIWYARASLKKLGCYPKSVMVVEPFDRFGLRN